MCKVYRLFDERDNHDYGYLFVDLGVYYWRSVVGTSCQAVDRSRWEVIRVLGEHSKVQGELRRSNE